MNADMSVERASALPLEFGPAMPRALALGTLVRILRDAGIDSAAVDGRILLCAALGIDHAALIRDPEHPLGPCATTLAAFAARRLRREPVSRILGRRDFWKAQFKITENVLDPRPETETLVEAVLDHAARFPCPKSRQRSWRGWRILDLGTGSGAILCSILQSLPESEGVGVDRSAKACMIARDNLEALGLAARGLIICGDWAHALRGPFDVVVSNPPYVASGVIASLAPEVRDHDPRLALDGGDDGLAAYRDIIRAVPDVLAPAGLLALELGEGQYRSLEGFLEESVPGARTRWAVEAKHDFGGCQRVVLARFRTAKEE